MAEVVEGDVQQAGIFVAQVEDGDLSEARSWAILGLSLRRAEVEGEPIVTAVLDEIEAEIAGREIVRRRKSWSAPVPVNGSGGSQRAYCSSRCRPRYYHAATT